MPSQDDTESEDELYVDYEAWLESLRAINGDAEQQRKFVERIAQKTGLVPKDVEATVRTLTQYLARKGRST